MFFKHHIFFCTNIKSNGSGCGAITGELGFDFAKSYLHSLGELGESKIRPTKSGCLGRCDIAPICVIYPEGIWYHYFNTEDVKEIIDSHLIQGKIVERLRV